MFQPRSSLFPLPSEFSFCVCVSLSICVNICVSVSVRVRAAVCLCACANNACMQYGCLNVLLYRPIYIQIARDLCSTLSLPSPLCIHESKITTRYADGAFRLHILTRFHHRPHLVSNTLPITPLYLRQLQLEQREQHPTILPK